MIARSLLLIALSLQASLALASQIATPRGSAYNTNFPGWDIRSFDADGPMSCDSACNRDRNCLAWTWVRAGIQGERGKCWLKNGAPTAVADRCCISGIKPPTGRMEPGVNRPGDDYTNFVPSSADPKQCENACYADRRCRSWTYVRPGVQGADARCWLKNRVARPVSDRNCTSGAKPSE